MQEESERKVREMQAVAEVSRAAISPLYLDEMLRVVAEMGARAVNARHCSVLLLDEALNAFTPRASYDLHPHVPPEPPWPRDALPLLTIEQLSQPVVVHRADYELQPTHAQWAIQAALLGLMCVPMKLRDRVIGLLNMWTADAGSLAKRKWNYAPRWRIRSRSPSRTPT